MTTLPFNAAATDFATQLTAAEAAFGKNPDDISPLEKLALKLSRRYRDQGKDILDRTSTAASFTNLAGTMERMRNAIEQLENARPDDAAGAMDVFVTTVNAELDSSLAGIRDNRAQVVYFRENNAEIKADAEAFAAVLDKLNTDAVVKEKLVNVTSDLGDLVQNTGFQDPLLEGMQNACDEQVGKVENLKTSLDGMRQRFQDAADMARTVRETVATCLSGTKAPMNVRKKPVSFKPAQA